MKRKFIILVIVVLVLFGLVGCTSEGFKDYEKTTNGIFQKVPQNQDLYYDVRTKIVYIIFNEAMGYCGYGYMSPYYAANGKPYTYNVESNILEEINE